MCSENTNDCSMQPCLNAGRCIDRVNDFQCECLPGFVGPLCQHNIDDCLNWPCANGGTCHDGVNDFRCDCAPGFSGHDCRVNINECLENPCLNGASCIDQVNDYQCRCLPGFFGKTCQFSDVMWNTDHYPPDNNRPQVTHTTNGPVHVIAKDTENAIDQSVVTMQQLLLIICLGVGIPILIIIVIIVFLLCNRRHPSHMTSNPVKESAQNEINTMNNKNKCIDTQIITTQQPSNLCLKITNEQDSRALPQKIVNTDKAYNIDKIVNYNKDLIPSKRQYSSSKLIVKDLKKPIKSNNVHQGIKTIASLRKSMDIESLSTSSDSVIDTR